MEGLVNLTENKKNVSHTRIKHVAFLNELDTSALVPCRIFPVEEFTRADRCIKSAVGESTELSLVAIKQHCNVT